jgi:hypothetical protein
MKLFAYACAAVLALFAFLFAYNGFLPFAVAAALLTLLSALAALSAPKGR